MKKKLVKDYTPIRLSDTHWSIDRSFLTHWLIRGDIQSTENGQYVRLNDDQYLKEHLKGHTYQIR